MCVLSPRASAGPADDQESRRAPRAVHPSSSLALPGSGTLSPWLTADRLCRASGRGRTLVDERLVTLMAINEVLLIKLDDDGSKTPTEPKSTPLSGEVHEVPGDLVETLAECWTRCRMAGLERAKGERWGRWTGLVSTVVTAAAGTALWSSLQSSTSMATGWVVTAVAAVVAVAVAIERSVTRRYQQDAKLMDEMVQTFHALHVQLLAAASSCRLTGETANGELLDSAKKTVKDHVASMSYERPSYDRARASVNADLRALSLYR